MRKATYLLALGAIAAGAFGWLTAAQVQPASAFDRMKTLVGTWQAVVPQEGTLTTTIRLVSNGTALEEIAQGAEHEQMVTLYTPDGNRLALTHYCNAGNQPRMESPNVTADQKEFAFSLTGITNLANPNAGHMHHLLIQIADADHFTETWTWRENGKDKLHTLHYKRTRS